MSMSKGNMTPERKAVLDEMQKEPDKIWKVGDLAKLVGKQAGAVGHLCRELIGMGLISKGGIRGYYKFGNGKPNGKPVANENKAERRRVHRKKVVIRPRHSTKPEASQVLDLVVGMLPEPGSTMSEDQKVRFMRSIRQALDIIYR